MAIPGAKTPRDMSDVQERLLSSHQDMVDMKSNLARLRGLSETEKTENAMLQSRLDEQSQLIMILKQSSDEKGARLKTLERINDELTQFRNEAVGNLERESRRYNMMDARFNELAENHDEMIKIKDDYKRRNAGLQEENNRLREDNAKLFSKAIQERDATIAELQKKVTSLKEQTSSLDRKNREMLSLIKQNEETFTKDKHSLTKKLQDTEERLKGASFKAKQFEESQRNMSSETSSKIQSLTKEKDDMLDLAMQRGKIIQEKVAENKKLHQKIEDMEKNVREMQLKFERQAAEVNANLQVQRLRADLDDANEKTDELLREYDAFKKHTTGLLDKEKELNARLRKLVG